MQVASQETFDRIVSLEHRYEGRQIECKKNLQDQEQLLEYKASMLKRKVILKLANRKLLSLVSEEALLQAVERQFGPVEMVYGIKQNLLQLGYYYVTMKDWKDAEKITSSKLIKVDL